MEMEYWAMSVLRFLFVALCVGASATLSAESGQCVIRYHRNVGERSGVREQWSKQETDIRLLWVDSQLKWSRPGFSFLGWSESADSRAVIYHNGQVLRSDQKRLEMDLFAKAQTAICH